MKKSLALPSLLKINLVRKPLDVNTQPQKPLAPLEERVENSNFGSDLEQTDRRQKEPKGSLTKPSYVDIAKKNIK